jgi:hypothetical protein
MAIYLGGILGGLAGSFLIARATLGIDASLKQRSVKLFGLHGPLGAWICLWGCFAMLTSAPLDDWWHNAYGLDVQILSPPHSVLAAGMFMLSLGGLLLILSWQNNCAIGSEKNAVILLTFTGGVMLTLHSVLYTEFSRPNQQHQSFFYQLCCFEYAGFLVFLGRAIKGRWAATQVAAIYTGLYCLLIWILPLFEAQPLLAPIYNPVDHMVPPPFPLLLVVPAIGIDFCLNRIGPNDSWQKQWLLAMILGIVFLIMFLPVQWAFASFQLTPHADNWFIGGNRYWAFWERPGEWRTEFWGDPKKTLTLGASILAVTLAIAGSRLGLWVGRWMTQVKR